VSTLVIDAQPMVALIAGEPSASRIRERVRACRRDDGRLVMCSVNWAELLYICRRRLGEAATLEVVRLTRLLPLAVVSADADLATYAAEIKARQALSLGDAFAAGLALAAEAPLLTGDADFLPLAEHGLALEWVGADAV